MLEVLSKIDKTAYGLFFISIAIAVVVPTIQYKYQRLSNRVLKVSGLLAVVLFIVGVALAIYDVQEKKTSLTIPHEPSAPQQNVPPAMPKPPAALQQTLCESQLAFVRNGDEQGVSEIIKSANDCFAKGRIAVACERLQYAMSRSIVADTRAYLSQSYNRNCVIR